MGAELVKLSDYTLEMPGNENALSAFTLVLSKGDAYSIVTDSPDDAHHLLRGVAALDPPKSGRFIYKGEQIDFSDYRNLLHYKRKVGYIATDAVFLSKRSIRDNLKLVRYYFEDATSIEMYEESMELCKFFDLGKRLDLKPHQLDPEEHRLCVIVRELAKNPEILLIEKPRVDLATKNFEAMKETLRNLIKKEIALIFYSTEKAFINEFANKHIAIDKAKVTSFAAGAIRS